MKYCSALLFSSVFFLASCGQSVDDPKPSAKDKGVPILTELKAVATNTDDPNPHYSFKSTEYGTMAFSGDCTSTTTRVNPGENTVRLVYASTQSNFPINTPISNCEVVVTDASGNVSVALKIPTFTVREYDKLAPVATEVIAVPSLTNNTAPSWTFNTNEEGEILYSGACSSTTTAAALGDNTIVLKSLKAGYYDNCAIQIKDLAGNVSAKVAFTPFTIDLVPPRINALSSIPVFTNNTSPSFILNSNENGTISYAGDCVNPPFAGGSPTLLAVVAGANAVGFTSLADHVYSNCTVSVTDLAGNTSSALRVKSFTIDTAPPVVQVVTPVPTPDNNPRPRLTFSSNEIATLSYPSACQSAAVSIRQGNTTISFLPLGDVTQSVSYNCSIDVTDRAGNVSSLAPIDFVVDLKLPVVTIVPPGVSPNPASAIAPNQPRLSFGSDEAGTIVYGGGCSSATVLANNGINPIVFNTIKTASYPNCTVSVIDSAGNKSLPGAAPFTVDMTPPSLRQVVAVPTYINSTTPTFQFSSSEPGIITDVGGKCAAGVQSTAVNSGLNNPVFNALAEGLYDNCTITVTDMLGNVSAPLKLSAFTVDMTPPSVAEVVPVPNPINDATPSFTFSTNEIGTMAYNTLCISADTNASIGNNRITFNALPDSTYSACSIDIYDRAGNVTNLPLTEFEVDTTAPVLTIVPPGVSPNPASAIAPNQPKLSFDSNEAGTIVYGGGCSSATVVASDTLQNDITFNAIKTTSYPNCTVSVVDAAGNKSLPLATPFVVDMTPPSLRQVVAVPTYITSTTPTFQFSSSELGTITDVGGKCAAGVQSTAVSSGLNNPVFNALAEGLYDNCTITVTDMLGNVSAPLKLTAFTVDITGPTVAEVVPVPTPSKNPTPYYTFTTSEIGTMSYAGGCVSLDTTANVGDNRIKFEALADAPYNDCIITVYDRAGNPALSLINVTDFIIDTTAPVLTIVGLGVSPNPASAIAPNQPKLSFDSNEAGTIVYGGGCSSATVSASDTLSNDITFNTIKTTSYPNCTVSVVDTAGNKSLPIAAPFVVDMTPPSLRQTLAVPAYTNSTTPSVTISSTEPGTVVGVGGACGVGFQSTAMVAGDTVLMFNPLAQGTYDNCSVVVRDDLGNDSAPLKLTAFTVDTTPPIATEVVPVPAQSNNAAPYYTFTTNEIGTMSYAGDCVSLDTTANIGNNRIKFETLSEGLHDNCQITVYDRAGNAAASVISVTPFTIDTVLPTLTVVSEVTPSPTNDSTPSYTFKSSKVGKLIYGGACRSTTSPSVADSSINTTVIFDTLRSGTYSNCSIRLQDDFGNQSAPLVVGSFVVDIQAPVLRLVTPVPVFGKVQTPSLTFSSTEAGTITAVNGALGACKITSPLPVIAGLNTVTLDSLAEGIYNDCSIVVTDSVGNVSAPMLIKPFTIDITAPTVNVTLPVKSLTNDSTPRFTFNSNEAGVIKYAGSCSSTVFGAKAGDNRVDLLFLADNTYSDCTITVTDKAGNESSAENIGTFTIDTIKPSVTEITPVPALTSNVTPDFTFNTTKVGDITFAGGCTTVISRAMVTGNTTVTLNVPKSRLYACTLTITDDAGNVSDVLDMTDFTVDAIAPTLKARVNVPTPANNSSPTYTFYSSEAGTAMYDGINPSCKTATPNAVVKGDNIITYPTLSDGSYGDCTIQVRDTVPVNPNVSAVLSVRPFVIDTQAPSLAVVTPVPVSTADTTPNFTFSSDEAGRISYSGDCSSNSTNAFASNNLMTFKTFTPQVFAEHSNCVVTVTDAAKNAGNLAVPSFTIVQKLALNDTGITLCGDLPSSGTHNNDIVCNVTGVSQTQDGAEIGNGNDIVVAGQDALYGRDIGGTSNSSDGYKGFSFVKLDANGVALAASATSWACVQDKVTGLIWEEKTVGGIQDKDAVHTYAAALSYVITINGTNLCGAGDWRLPTAEELLSIVNYGVNAPLVDSAYMPNTVAAPYWTSQEQSSNSANAWTVDFDNGEESVTAKTNSHAVRLVRKP